MYTPKLPPPIQNLTELPSSNLSRRTQLEEKIEARPHSGSGGGLQHSSGHPKAEEWNETGLHSGKDHSAVQRVWEEVLVMEGPVRTHEVPPGEAVAGDQPTPQFPSARLGQGPHSISSVTPINQ